MRQAAERSAETARMRRGEPAPTPERAEVEKTLAQRILRQWWTPWAYLAISAVHVVVLVTTERAVVRLLASLVMVQLLGLAAWHELNRRGAARLLEANRRRWG